MHYSNVFICCPANVITGGPELLHQFASKLQQKGVESYILYYPFNLKAETPEQYKHYNAKIGMIEKVNKHSLVVIPETATKLADNFNVDNVAVWWMSVDNYFGGAPDAINLAKIKHLASLVRNKKLPIRKMRKFIHLHQSEYARQMLAKRNIESMQLTDYLNSAHFKINNTETALKEKLIAFNPKKGYGITKGLVSNLPKYNFVPLQNMTAAEVNQVLTKAMIYIDFGNHPGKDRLPREAAIANCCIITGRRGSANNNIDVPIPEKYKIDENSPDFIGVFDKLCQKIFSDFQTECAFFKSYRELIFKEESVFDENVSEFVSKYIKT